MRSIFGAIFIFEECISALGIINMSILRCVFLDAYSYIERAEDVAGQERHSFPVRTGGAGSYVLA